MEFNDVWNHESRKPVTAEFLQRLFIRRGSFFKDDARLDLFPQPAVGDSDHRHPVIAPVGSFPANALGLHDMAGNVNEWVADWMEENYYMLSPRQDPTGPFRAQRVMRGATNTKVFRGGSWSNGAPELRSSNRKSLWVDYRIENLGFRCAADL